MAGFQHDFASMALFRTKMEKELNDRLEAASAYAETAVKAALSQAGGGKLYGSHRAAAPGSPPATWTGRLRASITHQVIRSGLYMQAIIGTDVWYAPMLEFGTSKMAPRPFLRVTIDRIRPILWKLMAGGR